MCNQSDSVLGGTLRDTKEWWLQTEREDAVLEPNIAFLNLIQNKKKKKNLTLTTEKIVVWMFHILAWVCHASRDWYWSGLGLSLCWLQHLPSDKFETQRIQKYVCQIWQSYDTEEGHLQIASQTSRPDYNNKYTHWHAPASFTSHSIAGSGFWDVSFNWCFWNNPKVTGQKEIQLFIFCRLQITIELIPVKPMIYLIILISVWN